MENNKEPTLDLTKPYILKCDELGRMVYIQDGNVFSINGKFLRKDVYVEEKTDLEIDISDEVVELKKKLEGEFECPICGKGFKKEITLKQHIGKFHKVISIKHLPVWSRNK
jgi:uncharacterized C2H2 Zn-finger protein